LNTKRLLSIVCLSAFALPALAADGEDLDDYKVRITALWWGFKPIGSVGTSSIGDWDLQRDFDFQETSTFTGNFDWRFARKHHLLFEAIPITIDRTTTLNRTITFEGQTFPVGIATRARLQWNSLAPGYQYDFIRRNHGYLAIGTQVYILDPTASLTATVTAGGQTGTRSASVHHLVGLPVVGPRWRFYPIPRSGRLAIDGYFEGMYFGKYGDFWSGRAAAVFAIVKPLRITGGYQFGTRLNFKGTANDIAIRLFDQGPVAGIELSF
jgi:hypothetical protein